MMVTAMRTGPKGRALLKESENCKLEAYKDGGGVWTLGWGHTFGVKAGMTCTQDQADYWLEHDLREVEESVNLYVRVTLSQEQFDSLVDFAYNVGVNALRTSTLLKKLNAGDYAGASNELLRWDHDNGVQVKGLTVRRQKEKALFDSGTATK